jgi:hypothetical protein
MEAEGQQQQQVSHMAIPAKPVSPQEHRVNHADSVNDYGEQETVSVS